MQWGEGVKGGGNSLLKRYQKKKEFKGSLQFFRSQLIKNPNFVLY